MCLKLPPTGVADSTNWYDVKMYIRIHTHTYICIHLFNVFRYKHHKKALVWEGVLGFTSSCRKWRCLVPLRTAPASPWPFGAAGPVTPRRASQENLGFGPNSRAGHIHRPAAPNQCFLASTWDLEMGQFLCESVVRGVLVNETHTSANNEKGQDNQGNTVCSSSDPTKHYPSNPETNVEPEEGFERKLI